MADGKSMTIVVGSGSERYSYGQALGWHTARGECQCTAWCECNDSSM